MPDPDRVAPSPLTRRELLKSAAKLGLTGALAPLTATAAGPAPATRGVIIDENRRPGTTDWQLTFVRTEHFRSAMIEGYCAQTSVRPGGSLDLFISAQPATDVTVDLYRLGYYNGKGGRHVARLGPFPVTPQPTPPVGEHRLRECAWARTTTLKIPPDWVSGVYLGKLSCSGHRYQSYIIFVLRDDRPADVLFQTSDTTWQAYNKWPENHSLYDTDAPNRPWNATTWVSYDRPYGFYPQVVSQPLSQGSGEFLLWEFPLCFWLEQQGYDVTYSSNIDTHVDGGGLDRVKGFLSVAHDEYWSLEMYDRLQAAIQRGLSVAFLCGNSVSGVVPLNLKNRAGRPHRLLYRQGVFGGPASPQSPEHWERHGPDESLLIGARTMTPANGSADWIVTQAAHWIFEGTGMKNGDLIPGLVGWEHHGDPGKIPGLEVIAAGEALKANGDHSSYAATVYPGPKGNWVFNAATIFWSMGLAQPPGLLPPSAHLGRPHGVDERVQRITANFLRKCRITPAA
jgi:hypothetical protein